MRRRAHPGFLFDRRCGRSPMHQRPPQLLFCRLHFCICWGSGGRRRHRPWSWGSLRKPCRRWGRGAEGNRLWDLTRPEPGVLGSGVLGVAGRGLGWLLRLSSVLLLLQPLNAYQYSKITPTPRTNTCIPAVRRAGPGLTVSEEPCTLCSKSGRQPARVPGSKVFLTKRLNTQCL